MKKICIVGLVLYSFLMMGCSNQNTPENATEMNTTEAKTTEVETAELSMEESTETPLSEEDNVEVDFKRELKETDNPRILELLNVSGTYSDGFNREHYHYQIPQFNADSESAKALNKRIEDDLSEIIDQEGTNILGGYSLVTNSVTYDVFGNGNITAIVVTVPYPNDCMDYLAYTYDFKDNKELTNAELLAMSGLTEEGFVAEVCRLQKEDFIELAKNWPNPMTDPEMINEYIAIVNEYASVDLPIYINETGKLQVYIPFASLAGADWYYQLRDFPTDFVEITTENE